LSRTSSGGAISSKLAVDANVLISALFGGAALRVLTLGQATFVTAECITWEVARYIPLIAARSVQRGRIVTEADVYDDFRALPLNAISHTAYSDRLPEARRLIGQRDPKDVDLLALALELGTPAWTHDRDFEGIPQIRVVTTAELLTLIEG